MVAFPLVCLAPACQTCINRGITPLTTGGVPMTQTNRTDDAEIIKSDEAGVTIKLPSRDPNEPPMIEAYAPLDIGGMYLA